jgi:hypothetical protein
MQILFHFFAKFVRQYGANPFHVYHTIKTHITSVCKINMKKIKINLHGLCAKFLLTSKTCCIDTILFYDDMTHLLK